MLPCAGSLCTEVPASKKDNITWRSHTAVIRLHTLWPCLPGARKAVWQLAGLCGSLCLSASSTGAAEPEKDCSAAVGKLSKLTCAVYAVA